MIPRRMLVLALLGGCALDQPPRHIFVTGAPADMLPELIEGADAWVQLGFGASFDSSGQPPCPSHLGPDVRDCEITIGVTRYPWLHEKTGADGLADPTTSPPTVLIDSQWSGFALIALMAHETGHVLFGMKHTAPGIDAIMAPVGAEWHAQPADYALACEETGLGC